MGAFNPKSFLRKASPALLAEFFERTHRDESLVATLRLGRKMSEVIRLWDKIPESSRKGIESTFREIDELAYEHGIRCVVEEANFRNTSLPNEFQALDGFVDKALWVFLKDFELFSVAKLFSETDSQPQQSWRTKSDLPVLPERITISQSDEIARGIGEYLVKKEMRGYQCSAERYRRGTRQYVFVYPDDYSRVETVHDDNGQLKKTVNRRTLQLVFIYDEEKRTLDTFMKGGKGRQDEVIKIFTAVVFGEELALGDLEQAAWALDKLLSPDLALPVEPGDGLALARLQKIRLAAKGNWLRRITFEADSKDPGENVHALMKTYLAHYPQVLAGLEVTQAVIQFVERPGTRGKQARWSVQLTAPDLGDLPSLTEKQQRLAEKYLTVWGIDVAGTAAAASRRR